MEFFDQDLLSEVPLGAVSLDGRLQIGARRGSGLHLSKAIFEFVILIPDAQEIHEQAERLKALVVLHLDADAHERLADFVERLTPALMGLDVTLLPEVLELAGDGLRGGEESPGDFLDRHGAFANAQIFDDLSLHRRKPADALLIVGREFIHHLHERLQQCVHRVAGDELREDDVDAVITPRKVMDRPDSRAPTAGGEELHDAALLLKPGDVLEEFGCLLDIQRLEMLGLEEAKKRAGPVREILHQPLCRGDDGEPRVFLNEGAKLFLPRITESLEDGIEILGHHDECAGAENGEQVSGHKFQRGVLLHVIGSGEHFTAELVGISLLQSGMNFDEEFE